MFYVSCDVSDQGGLLTCTCGVGAAEGESEEKIFNKSKSVVKNCYIIFDLHYISHKVKKRSVS